MSPGSLRLVVIVGTTSLSLACSPLVLRPGLQSATPAIRSQSKTQQRPERPLDLMPNYNTSALRAVPPAVRAPQAGLVTLISPDGRWVAFDSERTGVYVTRREGGAQQRLGSPRLVRLEAWSPDSSRLAFLQQLPRAQGTEVTLFDVRDDRLLQVAWNVAEVTSEIRWLPDARRLCYGRGAEFVVVDTVAVSVTIIPLPVHGSIIGVPAVSPDGSLVAFPVAGDGAWLASLPDEATERVVSGDAVEQLAWAPSGRQIAYRRDGRWQVRAVER
jgi:Tol biopolymer transport system component